MKYPKQTTSGLRAAIESGRMSANTAVQKPSLSTPALDRAAALVYVFRSGIDRGVFTTPTRTPIPVIALAASQQWGRWAPPLPADMAGDVNYMLLWLSTTQQPWVNLQPGRVSAVQTVIDRLDEELGAMPYAGSGSGKISLTQDVCLNRIDEKMPAMERDLACLFLTNPNTTVEALELARMAYTKLGYTSAAQMAEEQIEARMEPPPPEEDKKKPPVGDTVDPTKVDPTKIGETLGDSKCAVKGQTPSKPDGCCPGLVPNDKGVCDLEPNMEGEPCGGAVGPCAAGLECKSGKCQLKAADAPSSSNAVWWILGAVAATAVVGTVVYFGVRTSEREHNPVGGKLCGTAKCMMRSYGLTKDEALAYQQLSEYEKAQVEQAVARFRAIHGYPATNSPLTRGYLIDLIKGYR